MFSPGSVRSRTTWLIQCLAYIYPNDEQEIDRLDMQHHMFKMAMDGKLFQVPLQDPKKILDIGTGSGIWPIEMCMITHPSPNVLSHHLKLSTCSGLVSKRRNRRDGSVPSAANRGSTKRPFPD